MRDYLKRFSGTIAALVIFAVLLASVLLYKSDKKADVGEAAQKVFPYVKPEEILSIKLRYPASEVLLEKTGGQWFAGAGGGRHRADREVVENLIEDIAGMEAEKTVSAEGAELDEFGFVRSKTEFTFRTKRAEYPVIVGDKSPVGSGTYLYDLGEGRIILVQDHYLWGLLGKSPSDFRESTLIDIDKDAVDRISVKVGAFSVELVKSGGVWTQAGDGEPLKIDQSKVRGILDSLSTVEASGFVNDDPGDPDVYGLGEPAGEVGFFGDGISETMIFGKRKDEENFYVKLASGEPVYAVSKDYFRVLPKGPDQVAVDK